MDIWTGSVGAALEVRVEGSGLQGVSGAELRLRVGGVDATWPCSVVARDAGGVTLRHVIAAGETDTVGEGWAAAWLVVDGVSVPGGRFPVAVVDPLA